MSTSTGLLPETIRTDRLRLERLEAENPGALTLYEHLGHRAPDIEETTRYVTWDPHQTPFEAHQFRTRAEEKWEDVRGASYLVRPREGEDGAGEVAGTTGVWLYWEKRTATLGIWLRKPFWGRGYSGERADAVLDLAFDRLGLELVRVGHLPENEQSAGAIRKYVDRYGGRKEGTVRNHVTLPSGGPRDVVYYSISRDEWRAADAAATAVHYPD